jgi:endo-1,4-beta-xylanase
VGIALAASAVVALVPSSAPMTLRHLFESRGRYIGTAIDGLSLTDAEVTSRVYSALASTEFGSLIPRRELAWDLTEPSRGSFDFSRADPVVEFASQHQQTTHGEILGSELNLPPWVTDPATPAPALRAMLIDHMTGVVGHFAGRITTWHVLTSPFEDDGTRRANAFQTKLGDGYVADALRAARAADPAAKLYLSDRDFGEDSPRNQAMYALASSLKQLGVPLDGVDLQGHFELGKVPASLGQSLRRFSDLGLDVSLSQVDVRIRYPADATKISRQAADYTRITQACLRVVRCVGLTVSGVYDSESELGYDFPGFGRSLLFDDSFGKKPAYQGVVSAFRRAPPALEGRA